MPTLPNRKTNLVIKFEEVYKRFLSAIVILLTFFAANSGCSKLDTTDIGSDLIPAVDNVNTFETILSINATQGIFNDSSIVTNTEDHVLGRIGNDPVFGTTTANIYAQFKPVFFPYYYLGTTDTLVGFDSVVLCLSYKGFWGDNTIPMKLDVKEVALNAGTLWDSLGQDRNVNYAPPTGNLLGSATVDVRNVGNYVVYANKKDSVKNHVRIKLTNSAFTSMLYSLDSAQSSPKNGFYSDSVFRKNFQNGLAIIASNSNGLMYTNLTDSSTRLEVHYRKRSAGVYDTTFTSFKMISADASTAKHSVTVNNIVRNRAGFPVSTPSSDAIYLQTSPGTYANLKIPALDTLSNRIVHRAEIIIEQVPVNFQTDTIFSVPDFLYLDLADTTTGTPKWKPVYFDLNPNVLYDPDFKTASFYPGAAGIDYFYHGGYARNKNDVFGNSIKYYNFNITRYLQQLVTKHTPNYTLRLSAPYKYSYPQYIAGAISGNNSIAKGRVKVGSGTNTNYRMRLRIIYSKI
jgi:Domain of unknown function (DUF4270)